MKLLFRVQAKISGTVEEMMVIGKSFQDATDKAEEHIKNNRVVSDRWEILFIQVVAQEETGITEALKLII